jgi:hypothetical protein
VPELIEPVMAAFCALTAVGWFPPALLMAAELVNVPFELIVIDPDAVVAVRAAETVTSPPLIVIGPAIDVATADVIAAVFVLEPMVKAEDVDEKLRPAVDIAAANSAAPGAGSIVLAPVPFRANALKSGLFSCNLIAPADVMLELAVEKVTSPDAVPVLTVTAPEVLDTSAPFQ